MPPHLTIVIMIAILISGMSWFELGRSPFDLPLLWGAFETFRRRDLSKNFYKLFQSVHDCRNF
jgi:hypothetical protein